MASGKKIGTALVLSVLLVGLAAVAGVGSYFLMSSGDNDGVAAADGDGEQGADGDNAVDPTDADVLAGLDGMGNEDDLAGGDTGQQTSVVKTRLEAKRGTKVRSKSKGKSGKARPRATAEKKKKKKKNDCSKIGGVTKHAGYHYTLSNSFVSRYLKDMDRGQKQGSAGWAESGGKRKGVRIKHLKCAPRVAGLRNKDVVQEISGHKITTTAAAFLAYSEVKKADSFEVKVLRGGSPITLRYDVGTPTSPPEGAADDAAGDDAAPADGDAAAPAEGDAAAPAEGDAAAPAEGDAAAPADEGAAAPEADDNP